MLCFYDRMYATKSRPTISLEDLPKIKQEFQSRKIDQKFLAEDFSVATLSASALGEPNQQKSAPTLESKIGGSIVLSPIHTVAPPISPSASAPVSAPPPPAAPLNSANVAISSEKGKTQGRLDIIPTQLAAPIKKSLAPEVVAAPPPPPPPKSQDKTAIALYDYVPEGEGISVSRGEIVTVIDPTDPNWWLIRNSNGMDGWAPATFLQANVN
jgi:hypothetical protein